MRQIIVLLWSLILGQIVAYLGAALGNGTYNFIQAVIGSVIIAIVVILIGEASQPAKKSTTK